VRRLYTSLAFLQAQSLLFKEALDGVLLDLGRMLAKSIIYVEREELPGPEARDGFFGFPSDEDKK